MVSKLYLLFIIVNSIVSVVTRTIDFRLPFGRSVKQAKEVDVLVVGAGLCGSTASFYLNNKGIETLLVEEKDMVGGCLVSKQNDNFMWEEGANSFQPNQRILSTARDMGLLSDLVLADSKLPRYVYWNSSLHPLPMSISELMQSKLLSFKGKIALVLGLMGFIRPQGSTEESIREFATRHFGAEVYERIVDPFVSGVYAGDPQALSMRAALKKVHQLEAAGITRSLVEGALASSMRRKREDMSRKYPSAVNDNCEWDCHANELDWKVPSWRGYGEGVSSASEGSPGIGSSSSSSKGVLPVPPPGSLGSFKRGLQSLPLQVQKLLGKERVKTGHKVVGLQQDCSDGESAWLCEIQAGKETTQVRARAVLLTSPAYATAPLLATMHVPILPPLALAEQYKPGYMAVHSSTKPHDYLPASLASLLDSIQYPPVAAVVAVYPESAFKQKLDGFGHLIPRGANVRLLGSIWASTLFKGRAPRGFSVLVNFIGGSLDQDVSQLSDEALASQVDSDLRKVVLKQDAPAPHILGVHKWTKAIPQYNKGYMKLMASIEKELKNHPGLFLGGNYRSGVSVGDCIEYGYTVANDLEKYLKSIA